MTCLLENELFLASKDEAELIRFLALDQSLGCIVADVQKAYSKRMFKVGFYLSNLLLKSSSGFSAAFSTQTAKPLTATQKVVAAYLLHDCSLNLHDCSLNNKQGSSYPLTRFLLDISNGSLPLTSSERGSLGFDPPWFPCFLRDLLSGSSPSFRSQTAALIELRYREKPPPPAEPEGPPPQPSPGRPAPPVALLTPSESAFLLPPCPAPLAWENLGSAPGELEAVRYLSRKALATPLLPADQQALLAALERGGRGAPLALGLGPDGIRGLVENNPTVATEVLIIVAPTRRLDDYLSVLLSSPPSLHSLEVVNRVASLPSLPPAFLPRYISRCIASCEAAQDKVLQSRMVRLVCVFFQSLLRSHTLRIEAELCVEVQAFCLEFSRVREAASLFRVFKELEGGMGPIPRGG